MSAPMDRRAVLRSAPAAALVTALPAMALGDDPAGLLEAGGDLTEALIATHRTIFAALNEACRMTDDVEAERAGRVVTAADQENLLVIGEAEEEALTTLCIYAPPTQAGREAKVEYLLPFMERTELSNHQAKALVASIAGMAVPIGETMVTVPVASGGSEIERLFRQMERMKANLGLYLETFDINDPAVDVACTAGLEEIGAVARTMMAIEPKTTTEMAMQVAFWLGENVDPDDDAGEHGASRDVMRGRIRRLCGLPTGAI